MQSIIISGGLKSDREEKSLNEVTKMVGSKLNPLNFTELEVGDKKKNISVDEIRALIKNISIKPIDGYKAAIVKEAQHLSVEAQNAFLKLLEEPPDYALIILCVDSLENLLGTVISRCIIKRLGDLAPTVDGKKEAKYAKEIVELLKMDIGQRIDWITKNKAKDFLKDRRTSVEMLNTWETVLRDLLILSLGWDNIINEYMYEQLKKISDNHSVDTIKESLEYLIFVRDSIINKNANISLGIESVLVNL